MNFTFTFLFIFFSVIYGRNFSTLLIICSISQIQNKVKLCWFVCVFCVYSCVCVCVCLLQALMSLFVLASKDGWVNIMYHGLDAVGIDQQVITADIQYINMYID